MRIGMCFATARTMRQASDKWLDPLSIKSKLDSRTKMYHDFASRLMPRTVNLHRDANCAGWRPCTYRVMSTWARTKTDDNNNIKNWRPESESEPKPEPTWHYPTIMIFQPEPEPEPRIALWLIMMRLNLNLNPNLNLNQHLNLNLTDKLTS